MELATLSVSRIELKPLYGRNALTLHADFAPGRRHGFAATTAAVGWLISASRCRCNPWRPTYPMLRSDFQNNWRSTVKFQFHASGFLKALLCVVTTSGKAFVPFPPGLSTDPSVTLAFG